MASSIVKSAAEQLGSLLVEEGKQLYKVSDKIESLQTELAWMECFLRDADTQQHQEKVICMWVSQVRDIAYEAEDIVERYLHGVSHHREAGIRNTLKWLSCILYTCDAYTLHNLGSEIDSLRVKITELSSRLQTYGIQIIRPAAGLTYSSVIREERRTYSHVEEEEIVGLRNDVEKVVDQLVNTCVKVVGISGIGGLGKTTLARRVFLDKAIKKHFCNSCVWVYISKQVERDNVFQDILIGLHKDDDAKKKVKDIPIGELATKICELLRHTKCFVVLDDLWTVDAWESLKPAFASINASCGSKILLTTRNQGLLQHVHSDGYSHCLEPLSDEDSWRLLQLKAFPHTAESSSPRQIGSGLQVDDEVKSKMEKLGKEMLKHCHGLPLAIIALGGILVSKRTLLQWEHVQKNISSYLMTHIGNGGKNGGILRVLELSYQDLPFYLKPCFLYLGNFPEDYEISTLKLYQLWEAEGILAISSNDEEVEGVTSFDTGERYLHELIERCMVQVGRHWPSGRIKTCRVHDVMRDMCLKKCKEVCFLNVLDCADIDWATVVSNDGSIVAKKMRRCAFHVKELGSVYSNSVAAKHGKEAPYLRSLLVFVLKTSLREFDTKVLRNIRKSFPMLRVLDLEQTYNMEDTGEVGHLIHLRYLCLRKVIILCLSSRFWDLKYLVTLDLRCRFKPELPNKFHQMERLRHLYLPGKYDILKGEKLSFRAHQMETLKNFDPDNCQMEDLLQMTRLRIFSITSDYTFRRSEVFKWLIKSPAIQFGHLTNSLRISMVSELIDEDPTILTLLQANLCFTTFTLYGNPTKEYHNMNNAIGRGVEVFPSSLTSFQLFTSKLSKQVSLALEKHPHLELLRLLAVDTSTKMSFSVGSFKHLKHLILEALSRLEEWEVEDGALPNLIFLRIFKCGKLKKIPDGLPDSIHIECEDPCINGIEKYDTCPHFKVQTQRT